MKLKYNSKKVIYNGLKFDSETECKYYKHLLQLQSVGKVISIELQPVMSLISTFMYQGVRKQGITYTPDFFVKYSNGTSEYIDVKGMSTQQGDLRRKLFQYFYPDKTLTWVAQSFKYSKTGWIDYDELKRIRAKNKRDKQIEREIE